MNPHCRIGRVTPKGNIALLPGVKHGADVVATLRRHTESIIGYHGERMAGFAIVAWTAKGGWSRGCWSSPASPISDELRPSYVAEILRRDVAADVTKEVLRGEA